MEQQTTSGFWLSPQQKHVWTSLGDPPAALRSVCLLQIDGHVEADRLQQTLRDLVSQHETLRTVFRRQVGMKVPFQVVLSVSEPASETLDLRALPEAERQKKLDELFCLERSRLADFENG